MNFRNIRRLTVPVMGLAMAWASVPRADAAIIAEWDFGTSASPTLLTKTPTAANVTATGAVTQGSPTLFASTVYNTDYTQELGTAISGYLLTSNGPMTSGLTTKTSANLASNSNYWSVKVAADPGFTLNIDKVTFDYSLVSSNRGWALGYVADGGSVVAVDTKISVGSSDTDYKHIEYLTPVTGATSMEFRWYGLGNNSGAKNLQFDNINIVGTVVPEPTSLIFLVACTGVMCLRLRRGYTGLRWRNID